MPNSIFSVDVGSRSINVVQASKKGKKVKVKKMFSFPTPPNSYNDGKLEDIFSLKDSFRTFFPANKMRAKNAIYTVQGTSVVTRDLTLPSAKQEQLSGAVSYEMEQYASVDGRNNLISFRVVDDVIDDGVSKSKIKVATLPKDLVDSYYKFSKSVRKKPYVLDINSNSVSKLFSMELEINSQKYTPDASVAVIDFGYRSTTINIISKGVLEFTRLISYGSRDIDMIIGNFYSLSPGEAENKKIEEIDLANIDIDRDEIDGVYNSLKSSIAQLIRELQKVIQYYTSRNSVGGVDKIYIYGGGSKIKGIDTYFSKTLSIKDIIQIQTLNIPDYIIEAEMLPVSEYMNALGALIRL